MSFAMPFCPNLIRPTSVRLLTICFTFLSIINLQAEVEEQGDPFPGFSFTVPNTRGESVKITYEQGKVSYQKGGENTTHPITAELATLVPEGLSAAEINQFLRKYRIVYFSPQATYRLSEPLRIPSKTYIDFQQASLILEDGANAYMLMNDNQKTGNSNIILRNGRLLGNGSKQERNYTSDYRNGYFGFGTIFTKVDQLVMDNFHVQETNAWGIAYFLCGTVRFSNFTFDQGVAIGKNGDGITGIARNIYVSNISGYTNDDMVAVSTGIGTLYGNDIGISKEENIDVEQVVIKNVRCASKDGQRTHVGIGLYATADRTIKEVSISGLRGEFDRCAYRLQNYWPYTGQGYFGKVTVTDVDSKSNEQHVSLGDLAEIDTLTLKRHTARESGSNSDLLSMVNTTVKKLTFIDCTSLYADQGKVGWVDELPDKPSHVHEFSNR